MPDTDLTALPEPAGFRSRAAAYIDCSVPTLYKLTAAGKLHPRRRSGVLLWLRADLDSHLYSLPQRDGPTKSDVNMRKALATRAALIAERKRARRQPVAKSRLLPNERAGHVLTRALPLGDGQRILLRG